MQVGWVKIGDFRQMNGYISTRNSAIAERPRDASCQLKSCQLPRNYRVTQNGSMDNSGTQQVDLFCYLAVLDPRVGHTMDVLSPFIPVLCHSD